MTAKELKVLSVVLLEQLEKTREDITYVNVALKGRNQLWVEFLSNEGDRIERIVPVLPRQFSVIKNIILYTRYKCVFFKREGTEYREGPAQLWSRVAIFNDPRTPGLRRKFIKCNGRI